MTATEAPYKLVRGLTDLPLKHFIECAVDGNLQALVTEGECPEEILTAFWSDLQADYAELLGGAETKLALSLFKQLTRLSTTLVQIYSLIDVLRDYYVKQFADELNRLLVTSFPFDVTNEEEYNKNIESCINRSKKFEIDIQLKRSSYEAIQKGAEGKGEKVTHEYFQNVLIALSDHASFRLTDDISTYEYCQRIVRLTKFIEKLQSRK